MCYDLYMKFHSTIPLFWNDFSGLSNCTLEQVVDYIKREEVIVLQQSIREGGGGVIYSDKSMQYCKAIYMHTCNVILLTPSELSSGRLHQVAYLPFPFNYLYLQFSSLFY